MSFTITLGSQGDGDSGQQYRKQRTQQQKTFCLVEGIANLFTLIPDIPQPILALVFIPHPCLKRIQLRQIIVGKQVAIAHPAAELHHIGCRHILQIHHQTGAGVIYHATRLSVRLGDDDFTDAELGFAHVYRVAYHEPECGQGPGLEPDFSPGWPVLNRHPSGEWRIGDNDFASQRIATIYRLCRHQHIAAIRECHRRKREGLGSTQAT